MAPPEAPSVPHGPWRSLRRVLVLTLALIGLPGVGPIREVQAQPVGSWPGSTWGELRFPASEQPEDDDNLLLQGRLEQNVVLLDLGASLKLLGFADLDYKADTTGYVYNNKLKLGVGGKLRFLPVEGGVIDVGALYQSDYQLKTHDSFNGPMYFVDWLGLWSLAASDLAEDSEWRPLGYPGLIWGEVRYPSSHDPTERHDLLAEGAVEQGIDWVRVGPGKVFNTFASLEYTVDTEKLDYNNSVTVGAGAKLKIDLRGHGLLQIGVQYVWDRRWISASDRDGFLAFVNWSGWWSLPIRVAEGP